MTTLMTDFMNTYGYLGIMLLIAVENLFPPIPSELILTFGGFMTSYTSMHVAGVIAWSTVGAMLGSIILYGVGRIFDERRLRSWLEGDIGKWLRMMPKDVDKASAWFNKYGNKAVFFGRFIPIVRSLVSIPAGIAHMSFVPFFLLTLCGTMIWNTVLVSLGALAGTHWTEVMAVFETYSQFTLIVLIVVFVLCTIGWLRRKR